MKGFIDKWTCRLGVSLSLLWIIFSFAVQANDLKASIAIIPSQSELVEGTPKGGFIELFSLISAHYTEGDIEMELNPFARSLLRVENGQVDFHLPLIRPKRSLVDSQPYYYVETPIAKVTFVLYTLKSRPEVTLDNLSEFHIETQRGHQSLFDVNVTEIGDPYMGIQKLLRKRSDGFIFEQDAVDRYLRKEGITQIRRQLFATYDSAIVVPKTEQGKKTAEKLNQILLALKQSGQLIPVSNRIHKPFEDWQPQD